MKAVKSGTLSGDLWGGTAAMLVALPSAIAFGVTIFSALGSQFGAQGAVAGILGTVALGLLAPLFGGTNRLISAPCAPAAAVLSAFAIDHVARGGSPELGLLLLALMGLMAGGLQLLMGALKLGRLIKYMPYPVVSGYLSGVGMIIIGSQLPRFLGTPKGVKFAEALVSPALWRWQGMLVGAATIVVMLAAPKVTRKVPAPVLGLLAGIFTYLGLGLFDPALMTLDGNAFVVGALGGEGGSLVDSFAARWSALGQLGFAALRELLIPALTLAVLLSIDTLKTCVVLDALTRTRHDSNRELMGQGLGNLAAGLAGGVPGAGTMGATLVNMSSGAQTKLSGLVEGVSALIAFALLANLISWVPVASLSGILLVIGLRMIDRHSLNFLKSRDTVMDFVVIAAVVACALSVSLIVASGIGVVLAVLLFIREQVHGSVVRCIATGDQSFSKRVRTQDEMDILAERGGQTAVAELQGSLFFGTTSQLFHALENDLKIRKYLILDMRRVQSVDITAAHMLDQIKDILAERQGVLIFSQMPKHLPSGKDMEKYFDQTGVVRSGQPVRIFGEADEALEWVEDRILAEAELASNEETLLELAEIELFKARKRETLDELEKSMEVRVISAGEKIFSIGDQGDELFLIRKGIVRIMLPLPSGHTRHIATFGRGAFFGEMAFLDGESRSADAMAFTEAHLYVLSRQAFDLFAENHKKVGMNMMERLASILASRLRYTNAELRALEG
ncbi:Putative sulfate permease and related transporters (modular protein) [Magnetospirillum sp. XM-1]|uniref:SulP family inorganic anion transporter n=1 Tax=Magnetospirillum sp. XM-1 TaxID=1663591 RepID=UPI00073E019B|nr:SulP family inorganic anion transporter [Magnetospirillum sp. XM-1]CUW37922.1 Putative sulfate permease and related transporters (modular protein) [Magnetospirillum sp. XM-1]